jgi:hypothetical protein
MTSRFAANGTEVLPKRPAEEGWKDCRFAVPQSIQGTGLLDRKAPSLQELSTRFLDWVESAALAAQTRKYYANGWRLLSSRTIAGMRLDHIARDIVEALRFGSSAANENSALRTLRRMLHKREEWNLLIKVPKFKLWPEQGRKLRLGDDAEQKLLVAAKCCNWKPPMFELFRDVIILPGTPACGTEESFIVSVRKTWIGTTGSSGRPVIRRCSR